MGNAVAAEASWHPATEEERAQVLDHLRTLLESKHFSKSKRLPAFLNHVVSASLSGSSADLKERTIGAEVFGRPFDYETGTDPIVRVTAGELRKRLSQYYQAEGAATSIRIELLPGSYIPEFHRVYPRTALTSSPESTKDFATERAQSSPLPAPAEKPSRDNSWRNRALVLTGTAAIAVASWLILRPASPWDQLWSPFFSESRPTLIVVAPPLRQTGSPTTLSPNVSTQPNRQVSLQDAMAVAQLCGLLTSRKRPCDVTAANTLTVSELRARSILSVGGLNNLWTMRLAEPLRFRLSARNDPMDSTRQPVRFITDRNSGARSSSWTYDPNLARDKVDYDYSVFARFRSDTTESLVFVAAGLGSIGTSSAAEFATSSERLKELEQFAPKHWDRLNMEAVLQTQIIDGHAGHTKIVDATFW